MKAKPSPALEDRRALSVALGQLIGTKLRDERKRTARHLWALWLAWGALALVVAWLAWR